MSELQFKDTAEMRAHYAGVRKRCFNPIIRKRKVNDATVIELASVLEERERAQIEARKRKKIEERERRQHVASAFEYALSHPVIIKDDCVVGRRYRISFAKIERLICWALRIHPNELRSNRRQREIVFARQAVMYWARRLTHHSLPEIGRKMGGRDHTTVLHGSRTYPAKRALQGRTLKPAR